MNLIMHFYNEEYLLPFWIKWHKKFNFEKVVLIDYASNDNSIDIIKKFRPENWEIIPSRNKFFGAQECDDEVMDIEREMKGWKIVLNVTEFFVPTPILYKNLKLFEEHKKYGAIACPQVIITGEEKGEQLPETLMDFVNGLKYGIIHKESSLEWIGRDRPRYLHNCLDGSYTIGRHGTNLKILKSQNLAFIAWVGYYPWNNRTIERKMQIRHKVPNKDIQRKWGYQHMWKEEKIQKIRETYISKSKNLLLEHEAYGDAFKYSLTLKARNIFSLNFFLTQFEFYTTKIFIMLNSYLARIKLYF